MSVRLLVADALHLIDEHASAMPEGAYLELTNKMKRIHDQDHDQVHEPGAPEDLIGHIEALLRSDIKDDDLIVACARALGNLVDEMSIEDRASVMVGVMPTIIALLSVDSDEVKAQAAWTLSKMAYHDDDRTGSAFSGAIAPLMDLLNADSVELKRSATGALAMLAMGRSCRAATIVALGAIPPLISMLNDTAALLPPRAFALSSAEHAAEALANLAEFNDANAVAIASSGAIFPLKYEMEVVEALRDVHVVSGYTRFESWQVGMRTMVLTDEGVVLSLEDGKRDTTLWTLARLRW